MATRKFNDDYRNADAYEQTRFTTDYHDRLQEKKAYEQHKLKRILLVLIIILVLFLAACIGIAICLGANGDNANQQEGNLITSQNNEQQQEQQNSSAQNTNNDTAERTMTSDSDNRTKPNRKVCYLTFDDGPSENTHKILDILNKYNIKATWFVIGTSGSLDYVNDIWNAGNQLALHTWDHDYDTVYASTSAFWKSINKIADAVEEKTGFRSTLIRFPGGSVNDYNRSIYKDLCTQASGEGYHYFDWNVSSGDASPRGLSADEIFNNVVAEATDNNSSCVLMHDTEEKNTTVEALPRIIEWFQSQGYEFDVLKADSFGYHFWPVDEG